jgi:hypothetical protein
MRRLTLILSDLYLPADGGSGEVPRIDALPALSGLLRFSPRPERIGDWRRWLLYRVGGQLVETPLASLCAAETLSGAALDTAWLATPVALEARLDHVRMVDRGLLRLDGDERAAWCAEFNRVFGPNCTLHEGGERAFFLSGLKGSTTIADPARLLGDEIGPALPKADAPEIRRLWTEIEMWLHGTALNDARARAGKRPISALWLWGRNTDSRGSRGIEARDVELYGGDPLICALSRAREWRPRGVPKAMAQVDGTREHVIAEFAVLTGHAQESLAAMDANWFEAARQALRRGELSVLDIVANDRCFRITPRSHWRFWRRRESWLETLAR